VRAEHLRSHGADACVGGGGTLRRGKRGRLPLHPLSRRRSCLLLRARPRAFLRCFKGLSCRGGGWPGAFAGAPRNGTDEGAGTQGLAPGSAHAHHFFFGSSSPRPRSQAGKRAGPLRPCRFGGPVCLVCVMRPCRINRSSGTEASPGVWLVSYHRIIRQETVLCSSTWTCIRIWTMWFREKAPVESIHAV
jgi:hypothetical protein